jgi:tetratricopeptide (TPR) repeat protein
VNAQEADGYQLRTPSAEEYLAALPEVLRTDIYPFEVNELFRGLKASIIDEWLARYRGATVPPEQMIETLYAMLDFPRSRDEANVWGEVVVEALIATGAITLDDQEPTISTFGPITVEATPRDFNADGQPEWVIRLQQGESPYSDYLQTLIVQRTPDSLRFIDTTLPTLFAGYGSQALSEALFADMTGDEIPEWVVMSIGTGSGYAYGELIIFQWRDDSLVVISPPSGYQNEKTAMTFKGGAGGGIMDGFEIEYVDVDESGTAEVLIRHLYHDNWGCDSTETAIFEWVESSLAFQFADRERVFQDMAGCAVRLAEDAMWAHDYEAAVFHYERASALYEQEKPDLQGHLKAYAAIRLGLAYALIGEMDLASSQLDKLQAIDTTDMWWPVPEMIHALKDLDLETEGAISLCAVLWNEVASAPHAGGYWGFTYDMPPLLIELGYGVDASRVGCDLESVSPERFLMFPTPTVDASYFCCEDDSIYMTPTPDPAVLQFQRGEALYAEAQAAESAGDDERALASYVEIVTAAPETPWAKLAALHLEPAE